MIKNVEEAKGMTCCAKSHYCVADNCMAWRWFAAEYSVLGELAMLTDQGYCGLAGEP